MASAADARVSPYLAPVWIAVLVVEEAPRGRRQPCALAQ